MSSDTLVETPLVVNLIRDTLDKMREAALKAGLPLEAAHPVTPQFRVRAARHLAALQQHQPRLPLRLRFAGGPGTPQYQAQHHHQQRRHHADP